MIYWNLDDACESDETALIERLLTVTLMSNILCNISLSFVGQQSRNMFGSN